VGPSTPEGWTGPLSTQGDPGSETTPLPGPLAVPSRRRGHGAGRTRATDAMRSIMSSDPDDRGVPSAWSTALAHVVLVGGRLVHGARSTATESPVHNGAGPHFVVQRGRGQAGLWTKCGGSHGLVRSTSPGPAWPAGLGRRGPGTGRRHGRRAQLHRSGHGPRFAQVSGLGALVPFRGLWSTAASQMVREGQPDRNRGPRPAGPRSLVHGPGRWSMWLGLGAPVHGFLVVRSPLVCWSVHVDRMEWSWATMSWSQTARTAGPQDRRTMAGTRRPVWSYVAEPAS
jgi:hypothetical protein